MAHLKRSEKVLTHNTAALCLGGDVGISSSGPHQIHPGSPLARIWLTPGPHRIRMARQNATPIIPLISRSSDESSMRHNFQLARH